MTRLKMNKEILDYIDKDFELEFREAVIEQLLSIELRHVMAKSAYNLNITRMSILYLAKGNVKEVITLTERAKIDFRDVIMWAIQDKANK